MYIAWKTIFIFIYQNIFFTNSHYSSSGQNGQLLQGSRFSELTNFLDIFVDLFYNTPKLNLSLSLFQHLTGCCIVPTPFVRFNTIFIKNHKIPRFSHVFQVYCRFSMFFRSTGNSTIIIHVLISTIGQKNMVLSSLVWLY